MITCLYAHDHVCFVHLDNCPTVGDGIISPTNNLQIAHPPSRPSVIRRTSLPKPHGDKVLPARPPRRYGERVTRNLWAIQISRKRSRRYLRHRLPICSNRRLAPASASYDRVLWRWLPGATQVFPSLAAFPKAPAQHCEYQVTRPCRQRLLALGSIARAVPVYQMIWHHTGRYGCEHMHRIRL